MKAARVFVGIVFCLAAYSVRAETTAKVPANRLDVAGEANPEGEHSATTLGLQSACVIGRWDGYEGRYSDVWADGNYAYLPNWGTDGNSARVHVIDISNPANPVLDETLFIPFPNDDASPQDVKVGDGLLFVALEGDVNDGVAIFDVRDPANRQFLTTVTVGNPPFVFIHNVFYDSGFLYLADSGHNLAIVDLTLFDPDNPPASPITNFKWVLLDVTPVSVHDVTVRNGRLYVAGWDRLAIYDVSNVATTLPTLLGTVGGTATHSMWPTDDGKFVVTGEERFGGGIKVYEITDFGTSLTLTFRDSLTLTGASSVHNQLIVGNRLYNSWYGRGLQIFDIDAGGQLNFVAEFDTSDSGTGNWGVYPFLGSDRILLSDAERGLFVIDLVVGECACIPSSVPEPDVFPGKNRYLSFSAADAGQLQAIRVTFQDLPGEHAVLNGTEMWVQRPHEVCENSGQNSPPCTGASFTGAELGCEPEFLNWNSLGVVHVSHEGIVPGGRYDIQAVGFYCAVDNEAGFSAPLEIISAKWGDCCGPFTAGEFGPADGSVDVTLDVVAVLNKFRNLPGAPTKSRVDLEPGTPDQKINITDVTRNLDAFRGFAYPFPPGPAPCGG